MKTKTLILAIFSLLALANAGDREALRPSRAYADPNAQKPAYAYPGYQQPTAKRLAKRAAPVDYYYDVYMEPRRAYIEPAKAYTNPLRRLAKSIQPKVAKTNDYDYFDGDDAAYPEYRNGPTAERLAKSIQPKVAKTNDYDYFDGDDAAYPEYRNGPTAERLA